MVSMQKIIKSKKKKIIPIKGKLIKTSCKKKGMKKYL